MNIDDIELGVIPITFNAEYVKVTMELRGIKIELEYKPDKLMLTNYDFSKFLPQGNMVDYDYFLSAISTFLFNKIQPLEMQITVKFKLIEIKLEKITKNKTILKN